MSSFFEREKEEVRPSFFSLFYFKGEFFMNTISSNPKTVLRSNQIQKKAKAPAPTVKLPMADAANVVQNLTKNIAKTKESIEQIQRVSDIILGRKTQFSVDQETGKVIVSIIDPQTNTVIKEIPSAEEQRLKAKLRKMAERRLTGSVVNLNV
ncbi:MAG: flagellar protein FlaG [Treponema sp.]|nr:flagellar protein FlaG [Treponema sp.]